MWYVLQVKTGEEIRIRDKLHDMGFPAAVPRAVDLIRKDKEWTFAEVERVMLPGYVFIEMTYNAENYYKVKPIPGYIKFLNTGGGPSPLTYLEAEWIRLLTFEGVALSPVKLKIGADDKAVVTDGIMQHFESRIKSVDKHKQRAVFEISICGEPYTLELSILIT